MPKRSSETRERQKVASLIDIYNILLFSCYSMVIGVVCLYKILELMTSTIFPVGSTFRLHSKSGLFVNPRKLSPEDWTEMLC